MRAHKTLSVAIAASLIVACGPSQSRMRTTGNVQTAEARPEHTLLDLGIQVFDPGLPTQAMSKAEMEQEGVFPDIRKSEARYVSFHLKETLQGTGQWGAVNVVPKQMDDLDVIVKGTILASNGKELELQVEATDATGKRLMRKKYKGRADVRAYGDEERADIRDPFQAVYEEVAYDLNKAYMRLNLRQVQKVRETAEMRFAADIAPDAFGDYVTSDKKGRHKLHQVPSENDPMMERVARIRERDHMLVDALNEHYADFYADMDPSYDDWRLYSYEEQVALDELKSAANKRFILGGLAILGAVLAPGGRVGGAARDVAAIAGAIAIQGGLQKREEMKIHQSAIKELSHSFDSEIEPVLVDIEDQTVRLTGSLESQYTKWREILRGIFAAETGLPLDPNIGATSTPDAAAAASAGAAPTGVR